MTRVREGLLEKIEDLKGSFDRYRLLTRELIARLRRTQKVVDEQAQDEKLWSLEKPTAAYLQQALRRLHAAVEGSCICTAACAPDRDQHCDGCNCPSHPPIAATDPLEADSN